MPVNLPHNWKEVALHCVNITLSLAEVWLNLYYSTSLRLATKTEHLIEHNLKKRRFHI